MNRQYPLFREGLAALVLALLGTSCVPLFTHPPQADAQSDPALLGTWHSPAEERDPSQVSFFKRQDGGLDIVHLTEIDGTSEKGANASVYAGYTASVGAERVLCFRGREERQKSGEAGPFLLARYRLPSATRLEVQLFDTEAIRQLIEGGRLQGLIREQEHMPPDITVTSPAPALVEAMLSAGLEAFVSSNHVMRFERMDVGAGATQAIPPAP